MDTSIALATSRIPPANITNAITAIIKLDEERASEILRLMLDITEKAKTSSRTFKISSFEPNALYVPSYALLEQPAPNDFLVLEPDFTVTDVTPINAVHADIMPFYVCWEAYDPEENFKLTTSSINIRIIEAIAKGLQLPPNTTQASFDQRHKPSQQVFSLTKHWLPLH